MSKTNTMAQKTSQFCGNQTEVTIIQCESVHDDINNNNNNHKNWKAWRMWYTKANFKDEIIATHESHSHNTHTIYIYTICSSETIQLKIVLQLYWHATLCFHFSFLSVFFFAKCYHFPTSCYTLLLLMLCYSYCYCFQYGTNTKTTTIKANWFGLPSSTIHWCGCAFSLSLSHVRIVSIRWIF